MALEQLLQQVRQQVEHLKQLNDPQEVLQDPLVRGVLAAVLCLLFLLLLLKPSGPKEQQSKGGDGRGPPMAAPSHLNWARRRRHRRRLWRQSGTALGATLRCGTMLAAAHALLCTY